MINIHSISFSTNSGFVTLAIARPHHKWKRFRYDLESDIGDLTFSQELSFNLPGLHNLAILLYFPLAVIQAQSGVWNHFLLLKWIPNEITREDQWNV